MAALSQEQVTQESEAYQQTALQSDGYFELAPDQLPAPSYAEAKISLEVETEGALFTLVQRDLALPRRQQALTYLAGLRVMAVLPREGGLAYLPGVVIADLGRARIGCLDTPLDVRRDAAEASTSLVLMQQLLLGKLFAQHQPGGDGHTEKGAVNLAETKHASTIAAVAGDGNLHGTVHRLMEQGNFAANLSKGGATTIYTDAGPRPDEGRIFELNEVAGLLVVEDHQTAWPLNGQGFNLAVGITAAARRTQAEAGKAPPVDLAKNIARILQ